MEILKKGYTNERTQRLSSLYKHSASHHIGEKMTYYSTKTYGHNIGLACVFRQPNADHSHCHLLHGYSLAFKFTFGCKELDNKNWAVDFGGLKPLKAWLEDKFDHKLALDKNDPQIEKDALDAIRKEIQQLTSSYASGGRAGYANGEMVEEQVTETETMNPGPMAQSDNPISYDQLRARLPNEITDDIVELMSNSAEALEDFAMISSQQDVTQFNKKYSVNLVLPSEA